MYSSNQQIKRGGRQPFQPSTVTPEIFMTGEKMHINLCSKSDPELAIALGMGRNEALRFARDIIDTAAGKADDIF